MFQAARQYVHTLKATKSIKHGPFNFWKDLIVIFLTGWLIIFVAGGLMFKALSVVGGDYANNSKQELAAFSAPVLPLRKSPTISQADQTNRIAAAKVKQAQFIEGVQNELTLWAFDSQYRDVRIFSLTLFGTLLFCGATLGARVLVGGIGALILWMGLLLM